MLDNRQIQNDLDIAVTLLHVIGMAMVFLCHIFQDVGIYSLGELFIAAVPLFLFVAGFLSGRKTITNGKNWVLRKLQRIWIPTALFFVITYLIYDLLEIEEVTTFRWIFSLLNLQGLNYTYWKFDYYGAMSGCGHLWFTTTIMFSYFLTPLAQRIPVRRCKCWKKALISLLVLAVQAGLLLLGFQLSYLVTYFFGYFVAKEPVRTDKKWYCLISFLMVTMVAVRFILRMYIDGSIFYDRYIALISAAAVGVWIFYTVYFLEVQFPKLFAILNCPLLWWLERLSFYFYITHYAFLRGHYCVWNLTDNRVMGYILVAVFGAVSALLLQLLSEKVVFCQQVLHKLYPANDKFYTQGPKPPLIMHFFVIIINY